MLTKSLGHFPFPTAVTNEEGDIVEANKAFYSVMDHAETYIQRDMRRFLRSKQQEHSPVVIPGTSYRMIARPYEDQQDMHALILFRDEQFHQINQIIEHSYDGLSVTDATGVTVMINGAVERYTGVPREYFLGKSAERLITRGFLQESVTAQVIKARKPVTVFQGGTNDQQIMMTGTPIFSGDEVRQVVINLRDITELVYQYQSYLRTKDTGDDSTGHVEHQDVEMVQISSMVSRIANVDASVLLMGETGVGKDVIANQLYEKSDRKNHGEFIKVNCGAIPFDLLESELFGYEDGAFSGAKRHGKPGMFELADRGVIFLDEVGELPSALQVKLLRVLQDGEIRRIGGTVTKKVDVRIISATNQNLRQMVREAKFREDLYYRLNVLPIKIPPLRERPNDIDYIATHYLKQYGEKYRVQKKFSDEFVQWMHTHQWPGNIRELANLIQRLVITVAEPIIDVEHLPNDYQNKFDDEELTNENLLKKAAEDAERNLLEKAMAKYKTTYNVAKALNSSQATVARKVKNYGITVH
ncbi:sigma-54 interaction domain-containing protein [Geomicrobium sediminis]|uniref:HTH-type transcriptional regulatory protein TyrR n=1 Tax=Geomicrobium sediminis TaxID=1347788 RepID=A0ABS2P8H7_9BACL|nr:sigma 54-interacting transcriptional regulator [Geomicrobium sediminis]MBM7631375.1 PAS domain S-box-containing protein [Geomicrobium sediminis]